MSSYKCIYCNYATTKCSNYKKHLNTKKHFSSVNRFSNTNTPRHPETPRNTLRHPETPRNIDLSYSNDNKCKYCGILINNKHMLRHYINACIDIPDKIKNKYIIKHNKNGNSKKKLELVEYNNKGSRIVNNNTLNNNNIVNNIINNTLSINPVGKESIDHIGKKRIFEILGSGDDMLKEFCKDLYGVNENLNVYLDFRTKLITFVNKENELEIETMNRMLQKMVYSHMDRIKNLKQKFKSELPEKALMLFDETIKVYNCVITKENIDEEEEIEKEHNKLNIRLMEDIKTSIMLIKDKCKKVIESIKSKTDAQELELEL